jgi:hypothetical protein
MDIIGALVEVAKVLSLVNMEAGTYGPPTWPRRHKTFLRVVSLLIAVPLLLLMLPFSGILITGGIYLFCVLIVLLLKGESKPSPGMRFCGFCSGETALDTARCAHCFSYEAVGNPVAGAAARVECWGVDVFCKAQTRGNVVGKIKAMGLSVMEEGLVKVTVGPFSSQWEASKAVKALRRAHGMEGYVIWTTVPE